MAGQQHDQQDLEQYVDRLERESSAMKAELAALRAHDDAARTERRRRARRWIAGALVMLTSIVALPTALGGWTQRTLFSTDRFVSLATDVTDDPAVQDALAVYVTDEAFEALDVQERIETALSDVEPIGERAGLLAGPISNAAHNGMEQVVVRFVDTSAFQARWEQALTLVHPRVIALLRGDYEQLPKVTVGQGAVELNLIGVITGALSSVVESGVAAVAPDVEIPDVSIDELPEAARARLGDALGVELPEDFGQVRLMTEDQLGAAQAAANALVVLRWGLVALTLALVAATIAVSVNRRRAIAQLALGAGVVLVLGAALLPQLQDAAVGLAQTEQAGGVVGAVSQVVGSNLRGYLLKLAVALLVIALLAGWSAWLTRRAGRLRELGGGREGTFERWVASHANGVRVAGLTVAALVLLLTGFYLLPVLIVGTLLVLLLVAVQAIARPVAPAGVTDQGPPAVASTLLPDRTAPGHGERHDGEQSGRVTT